MERFVKLGRVSAGDAKQRVNVPFSAVLMGAGISAVSASIVTAPSPQPDVPMTIDSVGAYANGVVSLLLAGGGLEESYEVEVVVETTDGQVLPYVFAVDIGGGYF